MAIIIFPFNKPKDSEEDSRDNVTQGRPLPSPTEDASASPIGPIELIPKVWTLADRPMYYNCTSLNLQSNGSLNPDAGASPGDTEGG